VLALNKRDEESGMKGVVFLGDQKLELREFPDPTRARARSS
jgi:hypothetical protein